MKSCSQSFGLNNFILYIWKWISQKIKQTLYWSDWEYHHLMLKNMSVIPLWMWGVYLKMGPPQVKRLTRLINIKVFWKQKQEILHSCLSLLPQTNGLFFLLWFELFQWEHNLLLFIIIFITCHCLFFGVFFSAINCKKKKSSSQVDIHKLSWGT